MTELEWLKIERLSAQDTFYRLGFRWRILVKMPQNRLADVWHLDDNGLKGFLSELGELQKEEVKGGE